MPHEAAQMNQGKFKSNFIWGRQSCSMSRHNWWKSWSFEHTGMRNCGPCALSPLLMMTWLKSQILAECSKNSVNSPSFGSKSKCCLQQMYNCWWADCSNDRKMRKCLWQIQHNFEGDTHACQGLLVCIRTKVCNFQVNCSWAWEKVLTKHLKIRRKNIWNLLKSISLSFSLVVCSRHVNNHLHAPWSQSSVDLVMWTHHLACSAFHLVWDAFLHHHVTKPFFCSQASHNFFGHFWQRQICCVSTLLKIKNAKQLEWKQMQG